MTEPSPLHPAEWSKVRLVVFDVDGTLYDQRLLRALMARDLLCHLVRRGEFRVLSVLRAYRGIREELGEREEGDVENASLVGAAARAGCTPEAVRAVVAEWMERRPLPYLARCRYAGVAEIFAALRRRGKAIGVLSDYPAREKLAALGLAADHVVCAADAGVGYLKPHPRGLAVLLAAAGVSADEAVLIGDRAERDGLAARRLEVPCLIRSRRPLSGWQTFTGYDAPLFAPLVSG